MPEMAWRLSGHNDIGSENIENFSNDKGFDHVVSVFGDGAAVARISTRRQCLERQKSRAWEQ